MVVLFKFLQTTELKMNKKSGINHNGIKHQPHRTSYYNPQGKGKVERVQSTIHDVMATKITENT